MLNRIALAAATVSLSSLTALAEPVGIPACDEFLTKYEACLVSNAKDDEKEFTKAMVDGVRQGFAEDLKKMGREKAEEECKKAPVEMKDFFSSRGCPPL